VTLEYEPAAHRPDSPPTPDERRRLRRRTAIALAAAAALVLAVLGAIEFARERFEVDVTIVNDLNEPIDRFDLQYDERVTVIRSIPAGATVQRRVTFSGHGHLSYIIVPRNSGFRRGPLGYMDADANPGVIRFRVSTDKVDHGW
jgi:hypothetical protein